MPPTDCRCHGGKSLAAFTSPLGLSIEGTARRLMGGSSLCTDVTGRVREESASLKQTDTRTGPVLSLPSPSTPGSNLPPPTFTETFGLGKPCEFLTWSHPLLMRCIPTARSRDSIGGAVANLNTELAKVQGSSGGWGSEIKSCFLSQAALQQWLPVPYGR